MPDMNSNYDPCELLTIREAAALLHVSRPTVEKYIKTEELPSIMIGRCRRVRRADLGIFINCRNSFGWESYQPKSAPSNLQGELTDNPDKIPF